MLLHHSAQLSNIPRAGIVHRLDKDTSGLLVVAKTIDTQINLIRQLQQHQVKRNYLALVLGQVTQNGTVDQPIGRHPVQRTKMAVTNKGKPARTHYQILEQFDGCTLLQCSLETGRTHQIRVHMASIKAPVVGDSLYGGAVPRESFFQPKRQMLHASTIRFTHPLLGHELCFTAPLCEDMQTVLDLLQERSV